MAHTMGFAVQLAPKERICELHTNHSPRPHVLHWHHIHPLGEGGPDVKANKRTACPTGHYSVHDLLDKMLDAKTSALPYNTVRTYTKDEQKWAGEGYAAIMAWRAANPNWEEILKHRQQQGLAPGE